MSVRQLLRELDGTIVMDLGHCAGTAKACTLMTESRKSAAAPARKSLAAAGIDSLAHRECLLWCEIMGISKHKSKAAMQMRLKQFFAAQTQGYINCA